MRVERRKFPRVECRTSIQYRPIHQPSAVLASSFTKDVSAGGVMCQITEFCPRESRLIVQLTVPDAPVSIRTIAQVAWIRKQPFSDHYDAGLQFVEMTVEDRSRIMRYIDQMRSPF